MSIFTEYCCHCCHWPNSYCTQNNKSCYRRSLYNAPCYLEMLLCIKISNFHSVNLQIVILHFLLNILPSTLTPNYHRHFQPQRFLVISTHINWQSVYEICYWSVVTMTKISHRCHWLIRRLIPLLQLTWQSVYIWFIDEMQSN